MDDLAALISAAFVRHVHDEDSGEEGYRMAWEANGLPEDLAGMFIHLYAVVVRNGWAARTGGDVERVPGPPPITFTQFAPDHISV